MQHSRRWAVVSGMAKLIRSVLSSEYWMLKIPLRGERVEHRGYARLSSSDRVLCSAHKFDNFGAYCVSTPPSSAHAGSKTGEGFVLQFIALRCLAVSVRV